MQDILNLVTILTNQIYLRNKPIYHIHIEWLICQKKSTMIMVPCKPHSAYFHDYES